MACARTWFEPTGVRVADRTEEQRTLVDLRLASEACPVGVAFGDPVCTLLTSPDRTAVDGASPEVTIAMRRSSPVSREEDASHSEVSSSARAGVGASPRAS
jgi:hypothetical protein